jgi:protoporphyrinogen oxidase
MSERVRYPHGSASSHNQGNSAESSAPGCPRVAILGAGPAGLAAALGLARDKRGQVTVIERQESVGGNAGSFQLEGVWCDYGSHRFHPAAGPGVLTEVKALLGDDLLWRPRHGRILLQNRWIHFPLKPLDLILRLPKRFTASLAFDTLRKLLPSAPPAEENFATVLRRGLGATLSENFYYPYVRKLWGVAPTALAPTLAKRRVSGSSVSKILGKILRQVPGLKQKTTGGFYYPRRGFGSISNRLHEAAAAHGAAFALGAQARGIELEHGRVRAVSYEKNGESYRQEVDCVWSTLPITLLIQMMSPPPPQAVLEAARRIRFRGMILIYLVLEQAQFTEYDAHYFPELTVPISRLSEPKNYSASLEPRDSTVLCAELPADPGDEHWGLSDEELGKRLCGWLARVGLPVRAPVRKTLTRRLGQAYPVYDRDYEAHFRTMDQWLAGIEGLLTFGRQGLFAHDNTHHAMAMAHAACDCLRSDGSFDRARWAEYRLEFETHVVED